MEENKQKTQGVQPGWESPLIMAALQTLMSDIHFWAVHKGFWPADKPRNDGEMIALMHSELSEALEGIRTGNPPDQHCPEFSSVEVEMADLVIRVMDACAGRGWRLTEAIKAKMQYNCTRPHKHGKKF